MKFKSKVTRRKHWNKIKRKSHGLLFKRLFHVQLYKEIVNQFADGSESIRYYIEHDLHPDISIKHKLKEYHEYYGTEFSENWFKDVYLYTETYIKYKVVVYSDVEFNYGEDEYGLYFEVNLKINKENT